MSEGIEMKVRFTQEFTLRPPDYIEDAVAADYWFHDDPEMRLRDGLDIRQGTVEVLHVNE